MSSPQETRLRHELRELVSAQPFSPDTDVIGQRARKKKHQRAVATRSAVSAGAAVVVAGGVFGAVHGTGSTATTTAASPPASPSSSVSGASQLMSLAASVTSASSSQSGDASFVVMSPSLGGTALSSTYNIYADNGALYMASSESDLSAEVSGGGVITDPVEASEVAAAKAAASGDITVAREKMAAILSPFEEKGVWQEERQKSWIKAIVSDPAKFQQVLKANPGVSTDASAGQDTQDVTDSAIWNASVDALTAGAGNSQVRAGVLRLLATVPGITVTKSTTGAEATLTLSAGSAVLDGGTPEVLTVDATTGSPVEFTAAAGQGVQAAKATYSVTRVTLAGVEKGSF
ncbi:MAG TPA: hypothetical protein VGG75_03810 [Trebonia sp.]|jgi:hypothetical protein